LPFSAQKSHVKSPNHTEPHKTQQPRTFYVLSRLTNSPIQTRIIELGDKSAQKRGRTNPPRSPDPTQMNGIF
jgi:hypothetical protein